MPDYIIYYWSACQNFWGRATGPVFALKAAGASYEIKPPEEAPAGVGMAYPQVTLPGGVTIAQAPAIMDVLGEQLGLNGATPEQKLKSKQYVLDLMDIGIEASAGKLTENPERAAKWFGLLEARLEAGGGGFFLGEVPTVVDYYALFPFSSLEKRGVPFDAFPKLTAWWAAIRATPAVKELLDTGIPIIPASRVI